VSPRAPYSGATDAGRSRSHNEDAFVATPPLFAVADGLGGHKAGEIASGIAIDVVAKRAPRRADPDALAEAVRLANDAIADAVREGHGRQGMGTTLTAAIVDGTRIAVAHVGDSRAYLLRDGRLSQITRDHSLVGELVRQGTLTQQEARFHPNRSVITRALGSRPDVEPDTYEVAATPGDRLLICSDGLHAMIEDPEIERLLDSAPDAETAVASLVEAANDAGGLDNVTAVVVEIGADRPASGGGRRIVAAALWTLAAIALVAAAAWGTHAYARSRAYVIAEDGRIVVYRGLQGSFAGWDLSWQEQVTEIETTDLPDVTAARLSEGVPADSIPDAMDLVAEYRTLAAQAATETGQ
jgi:protein phosphatase